MHVCITHLFPFSFCYKVLRYPLGISLFMDLDDRETMRPKVREKNLLLSCKLWINLLLLNCFFCCISEYSHLWRLFYFNKKNCYMRKTVTISVVQKENRIKSYLYSPNCLLRRAAQEKVNGFLSWSGHLLLYVTHFFQYEHYWFLKKEWLEEVPMGFL